jgi:DEAD/DEAH box helicase domain-containing protein
MTSAAEEQARMPFRNLTFSVAVMTEDRRPVVETDAARAQRVLHKYAQYQHIDRYYQVIEYNVNAERGHGEIIVRELEHPEYTTTAKVSHEVAIINRQQHCQTAGYQAACGIVECNISVVGYYKVPLFVRTEPFQFQPLGVAAPAALEYQSQAFWLTFTEVLLHPYAPGEQDAGLYSLAGAVRLATAIEALCDPSDIEALGFVSHPDTGRPTLILYDTVPGGVGIAEAAFARLTQVLQRANQILGDCSYCSTHPESRGCPHCVTAQYGDETSINRHIALELLDKLRMGAEVLV